jgi:hypothetical protein
MKDKDNSQQLRSKNVQEVEGQFNKSSKEETESKHGKGTRKPILTSTADIFESNLLKEIEELEIEEKNKCELRLKGVYEINFYDELSDIVDRKLKLVAKLEGYRLGKAQQKKDILEIIKEIKETEDNKSDLERLEERIKELEK